MLRAWNVKNQQPDREAKIPAGAAVRISLQTSVSSRTLVALYHPVTKIAQRV